MVCAARIWKLTLHVSQEPTLENIQLLLNLCQEAARGIKHDVTGRQLPSCLLSTPCPCIRDVIAGAHTSATLLQLLKTYCILQEIHYSKTSPCQFPLKPAGSCGQETTHTLRCRAQVTPQRDYFLHSDSVMLWHVTTHPLTQISRIPAWTAWKKYLLSEVLCESHEPSFHTILVWEWFTENQLGLAAGSRTNQWSLQSDVYDDSQHLPVNRAPYLVYNSQSKS